jgi:two-component system cell cycle response regulator
MAHGFAGDKAPAAEPMERIAAEADHRRSGSPPKRITTGRDGLLDELLKSGRSPPFNPSMEAQATTAGPPLAVSPRRVLACDDSPVVRRMLKLLLEAQGYDVEVASNGEDAFRMSVARPFDLVISDVRMGALSGVQLCRLLRRDPLSAHTPIILLTAANDPRSRFWGRNAGADAYIGKDDMAETLLPEVDRLLAVHPPLADAAAGSSSRRAEPLERLSEILDELLFEAVVGRDVRKLVDVAQDRDSLAEGLLRLAGEVSEYEYLVLRLTGPGATTHHLHAKGPWPTEPAHGAAAVGLGPTDALVVLEEGPALKPGMRVHTGELVTFVIQAGPEQLGTLSAFGGSKRLAERDRQTLELVAREVGVVVQSLYLFEETRRLARTDPLTGLANRRHVNERLDLELERARRHRLPLSIAICDIDHFKSVNDLYGHPMGDHVLTVVARALGASVRRIDLAGRWGGEEFVLVLPDTGLGGARIATERLRATIEGLPPFENGPERVTMSIGVAEHNAAESTDAFLQRVDEALYAAKAGGRNRVIIG